MAALPTGAAPPRGQFSLLVVEDDRAMRTLLVETLSEEGFQVEAAANGAEAVARARQGGLAVVVTDLNMPELSGLDLLRELRAGDEPPHVITITAFGSIDTAIRAMKLGAFDYLTKPFELEELVLAVDKALEDRGLRREVEQLREQVAGPYRFGELVGRSQPMQEVFELLRRLSGSMVNVLITGESGTGKELAARAIHYNSPRARRPFVAINVAAIPESLLESELFGYKRGAFTDARQDRAGLFVEADGGTLFLDEVAELPVALQAKLLRCIQEREVRPLGATRPEKVDVRLVTATNRELSQRIADGQFREDLYYRLNVVQVALPPLRQRGDDVVELANHFLARAAARVGGPVQRLDAAARRQLVAYPWPGNVRELENALERAMALSDRELLGPEDLPVQLRRGDQRRELALQEALDRQLTLDELERAYIERVLLAEGGNKTRAAARLGLDRKTLYRKLEEYERLAGRGSPAGDGGPDGGAATR
jgi:two-component system response regulator PilR (NtrC family)/two-component system response regulator HydG